MGDARRDVWITGIGIVSCLGEGADAHWQGLESGKLNVDGTSFAPLSVHPLAPIVYDSQIPKKGDQRQMEAWQRIGTYAAGLALDSAGAKGQPDLLGRMDMIVAAGGGERDINVDATILSGLRTAGNPAQFLNERLMGDLRPTLFLAQLSNLMAGNISIVHGVTGSSRTFMGEEGAGMDAVRIALARIASGQSDIALVGGAHNGERKDLLMLYEYGHYNLSGPHRPVWERGPDGGFILGSLGAFLVLEHRDHAEARGAKPIARLNAVVTDRADRRNSGAIAATLDGLMAKLPANASERSAIVSGATGAEPATAEEKQFLDRHPGLPVRGTGTILGHGIEPQFVMNIALAALAVQHGKLFPPCGGAPEAPAPGELARAIVTGVGHWRGEGLALVEAV